MKILSLFALSALLFGQAPPPKAELKPETVVLETAGKKVTVADITAIVDGLPPQMRQNYTRDPKGFLQQWFMLLRLVKIAEQNKLQDKTPYKEGIEIARMQVLWQAQIEETNRNMVVSDDELKKAYEAKKDGYSQAKLKIIYIPFVATPAPNAEKKQLTEADALAKAEKVVAQARAAGSDFVKLVKENSEDPISKEKDGDFGPIKKGDNLPEAIKQTVFGLKAGETSDPIRQPNGYYIFRMVEFSPQAFNDVRVAVENEVRSQRMREWMEGNSKAVELKLERPDFFESQK